MACAKVANVENSAMPLDVAIQAWWWHYKNNGPSSWYNTPIHSDRTSIPVSPSSSDRQRNGNRKTPHKAPLRLRWLLLGRCLFPNTHTYTQCRFGTNAVNSEFNGVSRFGKNLGKDGPHYILIRLFNFSYLFQVSADSPEKL